MSDETQNTMQADRQYLFESRVNRTLFVLMFLGSTAILFALLMGAQYGKTATFVDPDRSEYLANLDAQAAILQSDEDLGDGSARISIDKAMQAVADRGLADVQGVLMSVSTTPASDDADTGASDAEAPAEGAEGGDDAADDGETDVGSGDASATEEPVDAAVGQKVFEANCVACHQMTGQGIPSAFPPLAGHAPEAYATYGRDYMPQVVLYGLQGPIEVVGTPYNGVMTPWQHLSDEDIAGVLNYTLSAWGNEEALPEDYMPYTAGDIAALRGQDLTGMQVLELRQPQAETPEEAAPTEEAATEETSTDAASEEAPAEEEAAEEEAASESEEAAVEETTEEAPAEEEATEEAAEETASESEEAAVEEATEEAPAEEAPEEAATEEAPEEEATEDAVEEATEESVAEAPAEEATEEVPAEEAPEEAATEEAPEEEATEDAVEEATEESVAETPAEEATEEAPAEEAATEEAPEEDAAVEETTEEAPAEAAEEEATEEEATEEASAEETTEEATEEEVAEEEATEEAPAEEAPEEEAPEEEAPEEAAADMLINEAMFANCTACHQMNGQGIPAAFPPLAGGHLPALAAADRDYPIQVVLNGLQGPITVQGMNYVGVMTPWSSILDDEQIAGVLNYAMTSWDNAFPDGVAPYTAEDVARLRPDTLTPAEVYEQRPDTAE